jgi:TolB-like protein
MIIMECGMTNKAGTVIHGILKEKRMKKPLAMMGILVCMLVFGTEIALAQTVQLDTAINNMGGELSNNLISGSKVAVLSMRTNSSRMSDYIIEELTSVLVNRRKVTVVDRAQLDLIQQEMNFQMSGEVSDSSAQAIGKKLGAQSIITGSFEPVGNYYRFRVRVIEVETAAILVTLSANVQNDQTVASLMSGASVGVNPQASVPATSAPATVYSAGYEDFHMGQRWGTWALNNFVFPGLGSYVIMQDVVGGTVLLITSALGIGLFIGGYVNILDSVGYETVYDDYGYSSNEPYIDSEKASTGAIYIALGGSIMLFDFIYNIVRSSSYSKPRPRMASLIDPAAWSVAALPGKDGAIDKVQLAYTMHF